MLTEKGFSATLAIIFSVHPQLQPIEKNRKFVLDAWFRMLKDIGDQALIDAATRFVMQVPKLFPGDNFIAMVRQLARPTLPETEGDVIELAFQAVRDFGYMREDDAMAWLKNRSPLIAAAVRRIGFIEICRCEEPDVIRGQLRAIFKSEKGRAEQLGGIIESAKDLNNGFPDAKKLIGLTEKIGKGFKALPEKE